jgi:hypothetical protein
MWFCNMPWNFESFCCSFWHAILYLDAYCTYLLSCCNGMRVTLCTTWPLPHNYWTCFHRMLSSSWSSIITHGQKQSGLEQDLIWWLKLSSGMLGVMNYCRSHGICLFPPHHCQSRHIQLLIWHLLIPIYCDSYQNDACFEHMVHIHREKLLHLIWNGSSTFYDKT